MFKEICFLVQTPFTARDYQRFGVETLKSRGLRVTILDLTQILNPGVCYPHDKFDYKERIIFDNHKSVNEFFKNNNKDILVIDFFGSRKETFFIFRLFKKFNISYASFCANSIPWPETRKKKRLFVNAMDLENFFNKPQPPKYILAGGVKYAKKYPQPIETTKIIWAHTLDYDLFLQYKANNRDPIIKNKYTVFLDEYYPYHPDFYVLRNSLKNPYPQQEKYYDELNGFLSQIEEKLGIPVVIAAHPRSHYENKPELFRGRRVFKGQTIDLVAQAECVLAHSSTSINFAVLYKKPLIFLTSSAIRNNLLGGFIDNFSRQLGKKPLGIDEKLNINLDEELAVDHGLYSRYKTNYIKLQTSPDKPFWEIVADSL